MKSLLKISILFAFAFSFTITSCSIYGEEDFLDSNIECSEFCDTYGNGYSTYIGVDFDGDQGDCMSLCNTCNNPSESIATTAVCICNWQDERRGDQGLSWSEFSNGEYKNFGQCVKFTKDLLTNDQ